MAKQQRDNMVANHYGLRKKLNAIQLLPRNKPRWLAIALPNRRFAAVCKNYLSLATHNTVLCLRS